MNLLPVSKFRNFYTVKTKVQINLKHFGILITCSIKKKDVQLER